MKKKVMITIIIALIIVIIGLFIGYKIINRYENPNKSLLIVRSYQNHSWVPTFNGTAIFDDGTIYSWKFNGNNNDYKKYIGDYDINTKNGLKDFILNKGNKKIKRVSNDDLEELKNYINNLTDEDTNFDINCHGSDIGNSSVVVYKNNTKFTLSTSGDCDGDSKNDNVLKLLSHINKYL